MARDSGWESMLDMFIFETRHLIEDLEQSILSSEKSNSFESNINEIFRIMHTVKSSAAMMLFDNLATLAHTVEDLFFYLREMQPANIDYAHLSDTVLKSLDFMKNEIDKLEMGKEADGDASPLIKDSLDYLAILKQSSLNNPRSEPDSNNGPSIHIDDENKAYCYRAQIFFEEDCAMENVRAFLLIHKLKEIADNIAYYPGDIADNAETAVLIKSSGFSIEFCSSLNSKDVEAFILQTAFIRDLQLNLLNARDGVMEPGLEYQKHEAIISPSQVLQEQDNTTLRKPNLISVNIDKLDVLMDLVGELVISESMVTHNPELEGISLDSFRKATRQLSKITRDLQDIVMSIRMVPLTLTFQKMQRLVRDMSHKLDKAVQLDLIGEQTEVDKNIIEHISDPLMHLIRNCIDHGIESSESRLAAGKPALGRINLEAKTAGGDVWILVSDDGQGLDRAKILKRAREHGLVNEDVNLLTDRQIYSFICLPGFSTNDQITEYSGRGVGLDVVSKNIEKLGGTVIVDSNPGMGTTISLKIPLTLAIIEGMIIKTGTSRFTLPMTIIKESFRIEEKDVITDPGGNELVMVRGKPYSIIRLHKLFNLHTPCTSLQDGIIIMLEDQSKAVCLFADALLGEQQVVIKALPEFVKEIRGKSKNIAGCTLLGDGSISLILDVASLIG